MWGVGCGVWGVGRTNKHNLVSPVSESPASRLDSGCYSRKAPIADDI
ncbi:hypothetical protein N0824_01828 [Microcystis sp. 0824]|nr:hypothetical protein N0824_01828 [Microcystis sp. 0824]